MTLPKFLQAYKAAFIPEVPKLNIDREFQRDKLISNILNSEDVRAIGWVFRNILIKSIKRLVKYPLRWTWSYDALIYWQKTLKVKPYCDFFLSKEDQLETCLPAGREVAP